MVARRKKKPKFKNDKQMGSFVDVKFEIVGDHKHGKQSHTFEAEIHYYEKGEGAPLLLVHGIGQSLYTWRENVDIIAEQGFRVIAVDLAGFGYSSHPNIYYTVEETAIILKAFMEKMKIEKAHFVGFSTGALSIIILAQKYPKAVDKLVLISPGGPSENYPFALRFLTTRLGHNIFRFRFSQNSLEQLLKELYFDKPLVNQDIVEQYYAPYKRKRVRDTLCMSMSHYDDKNVISLLHATRHDTLVMSGINDPIHSMSMVKEYAKNISGAEHVRLRNCGHLVHEEKASRTNSEILKFLEHK